ncbi:MAG: hypothetical protein CMN94_06055 [Synechococcus sp. EAC657]|nr:hypothetical protein [Synechococcus sp. EAC657]
MSALRLPIPPRLHVVWMDATRWQPVINTARIVRQVVGLLWHLPAEFLHFDRRTHRRYIDPSRCILSGCSCDLQPCLFAD